MNIELEEVVVMDVSDDALELAAGGAQGGGVITQPVIRGTRLFVCRKKPQAHVDNFSSGWSQ